VAEKTIPEIFGTGSVRLASAAAAPSAGLFIPDSALITAGLTSPSTANAEGLFAAIILGARTPLNQTDFATNFDQSIYATTGFSSFTTRNSISLRVDQVTYNFAKVDSGATLNPGDY